MYKKRPAPTHRSFFVVFYFDPTFLKITTDVYKRQAKHSTEYGTKYSTEYGTKHSTEHGTVISCKMCIRDRSQAMELFKTIPEIETKTSGTVSDCSRKSSAGNP